MPPDLRTVGIVGGGALLLALLAFILWPIIKGLRDTAEDTADVAGDITGSVSAVTGLVADATKKTTDTFGSLVAPTHGHEYAAQNQREGRPALILQLVANKQSGGKGILFGTKRNEIALLVQGPDGRPVPGVKVRGIPVHRAAQAFVGGRDFFPDSQGILKGVVSVKDVIGTDKEDDIDWVATHKDYSASNVVRTT